MVQYNVMVFCVCVRVPAGGQCDGPSQHVGGRGQCSVPRRGVHQGGALQEEVPPLHPPALRTPSPPTPRRRRTPTPPTPSRRPWTPAPKPGPSNQPITLNNVEESFCDLSAMESTLQNKRTIRVLYIGRIHSE